MCQNKENAAPQEVDSAKPGSGDSAEDPAKTEPEPQPTESAKQEAERQPSAEQPAPQPEEQPQETATSTETKVRISGLEKSTFLREEFLYKSFLTFVLSPNAVRWRGFCCGDVAVCLYVCVCHVNVLCQNDSVDRHATFTRL